MLRGLGVLFYLIATFNFLFFLHLTTTEDGVDYLAISILAGTIPVLFFGAMSFAADSAVRSLQLIASSVAAAPQENAQDQPIALRTPPKAMTMAELEEQLRLYGITQDGDAFVYATYRYADAKDAIAYARKERGVR